MVGGGQIHIAISQFTWFNYVKASRDFLLQT